MYSIFNTGVKKKKKKKKNQNFSLMVGFSLTPFPSLYTHTFGGFIWVFTYRVHSKIFRDQGILKHMKFVCTYTVLRVMSSHL